MPLPPTHEREKGATVFEVPSTTNYTSPLLGRGMGTPLVIAAMIADLHRGRLRT